MHYTRLLVAGHHMTSSILTHCDVIDVYYGAPSGAFL